MKGENIDVIFCIFLHEIRKSDFRFQFFDFKWALIHCGCWWLLVVDIRPTHKFQRVTVVTQDVRLKSHALIFGSSGDYWKSIW